MMPRYCPAILTSGSVSISDVIEPVEILEEPDGVFNCALAGNEVMLARLCGGVPIIWPTIKEQGDIDGPFYLKI